MAYLRSIKNREVLNSDQRTDYLKDKTIFISATNTASNNIIYKNSSGCLQATNSYATKYSIAKGHNLVITDCSFQTNSLKPAIQGNMNEANFIAAKMPPGGLRFNSIIHSTTWDKEIAEITGRVAGPNIRSRNAPNNLIDPNDPLEPGQPSGEFGLENYTKWDASGVLIDPNRIFINKEICGPLVYLNDPSGGQYFDLSLNNGSSTDYIEMVRNNTQLTNFRLNQSISLKPYK
tara:strand:- start:26 stop:724 length:699 start_codon:yes stop_codon:yes gene_type:complete